MRRDRIGVSDNAVRKESYFPFQLRMLAADRVPESQFTFPREALIASWSSGRLVEGACLVQSAKAILLELKPSRPVVEGALFLESLHVRSLS